MNFNLDAASNFLGEIPGKLANKASSAFDGLVSNVTEQINADLIAEVPDYARFMRVVENQDLARSNTFLVRFEDFRSVINSDGIVGKAESFVSDSLNGFGLGSLNVSRIKDIAYNNAQKFFTPKMKSIMGAYDPSLIRMIPGAGEAMDMFLGTGYDINRDLALMVKSVSLPGTSFETQVNKTDRKPFHEVRGRTYDNVRVTFYCTPGYQERILMLAWMNSVHNSKRGTYGFYSQYARSMDIVTLDRKGIKTSVVHCDGLFPVRVSEINLDYETNNQIATVEVEFAISTMTHIESKGVQGLITGAESLFNRIKGSVGALR